MNNTKTLKIGINGLSDSRGGKIALGGTVTGNTTVDINKQKSFEVSANGGYLAFHNSSGLTEIYTEGSDLNMGIFANNSSKVTDGIFQIKSNSTNGLQLSSQEFIKNNGTFNRNSIELSKDLLRITDHRIGTVNYNATAALRGQTVIGDAVVATANYIGVLAPQIKIAADAATFSDGNIDLATGGELLIDGFQTTAGNRVLVGAQDNPIENGVYDVSAGSWTRSADFDDAETDFIAWGVYVPVTNGDTYAGTAWTVDDIGTQINIDSDSITFTQFGGSFVGDGLITVDGYVTQEGDRVLLMGNGAMNGVWIASAGTWVRSADYDISGEVAVNDVFKQTAGNHAYSGTSTTNGSYVLTSTIDNGTVILNYSLLVFDGNFFIDGSQTIGDAAKGLEYAGDYSANYSANSLVSKGFVQNFIASGVTASNGLSKSGSDIHLGGTLTGDTAIDGEFALNVGTNDPLTAFILRSKNVGGNALDIRATSNNANTQYVSIETDNDSNIMYFKAIDGGGETQIRLGSSSNGLSFGSTWGGFGGVKYESDYSAQYSQRSLVDKGYVDNAFATSGASAGNGLHKIGNRIVLGGNLTGDTTIGGATSNYKLSLGDIDGSNTGLKAIDLFANGSVANIRVKNETSNGGIHLEAWNDDSNDKVSELRLDAGLSNYGRIGLKVAGFKNNSDTSPTYLTLSLDQFAISGTSIFDFTMKPDTHNGAVFTDNRSNLTWFTGGTGIARGIEYGGDYSSGYTPRSLVDYGFLTGYTSTGSGSTSANNGLTKLGSTIKLGGSLTNDTSIDGGDLYNFNIVNMSGVTVSSHGGNSLIISGNTNSVDSNSWISIAYGAGLYVAISNGSNEIQTSPDGQTWTLRSGSTSSSWSAISYGAGLFVVVAYNTNNIQTSPDGINWTLHTGATSAGWQSLAYGNGVFVSLSSTSNDVQTSPDGINWTLQAGATSGGWYEVVYGNGLFVAIAPNSTNIQTSPDGVTWTLQTGASNDAWYTIAYGNGLFVAVANNNNSVQTSPDGITWTLRTGAFADSWYALAFGGGLFVAAAQGSGNIQTSEDGINWTLHTGGITGIFASMAYNNHRFVSVALAGSTDVLIVEDTITFKGIQYGHDYSSNYTNRSLVDKAYVTGLTSGFSVSANNGLTKSGNNIHLGGSLTGNTIIDGGASVNKIQLGNFGTFPLSQFDVNVRDGIKLLTSVSDASIVKVLGNVVAITGQSNGDIFGSAAIIASETDTTLLAKIEVGAQFLRITDNRTFVPQKGIEYAADYSSNYVARSLVDYGFVTGYTSTGGGAVTASNGITKVGQDIQLGGSQPLTNATTILGDGFNLTLGDYGGAQYLDGFAVNSNSVNGVVLTEKGAGMVSLISLNASDAVKAQIDVGSGTGITVTAGNQDFYLSQSGVGDNGSLFHVDLTATSGISYVELRPYTYSAQIQSQDSFVNGDFSYSLTNKTWFIDSDSSHDNNAKILLSTTGKSGSTTQIQLGTAAHAFKIIDSRSGTTAVGIEYAGDLSANFGARSLVDKGYVDGVLTNKILVQVSSNVTLSSNVNLALVDTTTSGLTVTLPSSVTDGKVIKIKDKSGNANVKNVTINGNGHNIDGASTALINTNYGGLELTYSLSDTAWFITGFVN